MSHFRVVTLGQKLGVKAGPTQAQKDAWAREDAHAAALGVGLTPCARCQKVRAFALATYGRELPAGRAVFNDDLAAPDRGFVLTGVTPNTDDGHWAVHLKAAKAVAYEAREARRKAAALRAMAKGLKADAPAPQAKGDTRKRGWAKRVEEAQRAKEARWR